MGAGALCGGLVSGGANEKRVLVEGEVEEGEFRGRAQ